MIEAKRLLVYGKLKIRLFSWFTVSFKMKEVKYW